MGFWEATPFILLGVLVVLLPIGVIALTASKLQPSKRTAAFVLYGAAIFLLAIIAADIMQSLPNRTAVDLVLLFGGVALGLYAGELFPFRWPRGRRPGG